MVRTVLPARLRLLFDIVFKQPCKRSLYVHYPARVSAHDKVEVILRNVQPAEFPETPTENVYLMRGQTVVDILVRKCFRRATGHP